MRNFAFGVAVMIAMIFFAMLALSSCAEPPEYNKQNFQNSPASENVASYFDDVHGVACYYLIVAPQTTFQCFDVRP